MASFAPLSPDSFTPKQDIITLTPIVLNKFGSVLLSELYGESLPGPRPKSTPHDDLVLLREVPSFKAHVAPNGTTKEQCKTES